MENQRKKTNNYILFSIAIILTKFAGMGDFAIYPITNQFYDLFPGMEGIVNYIISGPQLIIMAMAFVVPLLSGKISKKNLIVFSAAIFGVGSLLSAAIVNPWVIALGRTLVGAAQGILSVVSVTIISDVITEQDKQVKYVGVFNASGNMAAMLLSLGAGVLAGYSWKHPFLLYLISLPMLLAAIFFIPAQKEAAADKTGPAKVREKASLGTEFWVMAVAAAVFSMLRTIIMYYMSAYVTENSLGGSDVAATAASMAQLFAFVGAMSFTLVYSRIERWIMPIACGIMSAALLLWYAVPGAATVFIVYCLACGSSGLFMAYTYAHAMIIVDQKGIDTAIAILGAICGVAAFVPTYLVTFLMKLFGTASVTPILWVPFLIGAALFGVCLVYTVILKKNKRRTGA